MQKMRKVFINQIMVIYDDIKKQASTSMLHLHNKISTLIGIGNESHFGYTLGDWKKGSDELDDEKSDHWSNSREQIRQWNGPREIPFQAHDNEDDQFSGETSGEKSNWSIKNFLIKPNLTLSTELPICKPAVALIKGKQPEEFLSIPLDDEPPPFQVGVPPTSELVEKIASIKDATVQPASFSPSSSTFDTILSSPSLDVKSKSGAATPLIVSRDVSSASLDKSSFPSPSSCDVSPLIPLTSDPTPALPSWDSESNPSSWDSSPSPSIDILLKKTLYPVDSETKWSLPIPPVDKSLPVSLDGPLQISSTSILSDRIPPPIHLKPKLPISIPSTKFSLSIPSTELTPPTTFTGNLAGKILSPIDLKTKPFPSLQPNTDTKPILSNDGSLRIQSTNNPSIKALSSINVKPKVLPSVPTINDSLSTSSADDPPKNQSMTHLPDKTTSFLKEKSATSIKMDPKSLPSIPSTDSLPIASTNNSLESQPTSIFLVKPEPPSDMKPKSLLSIMSAIDSLPVPSLTYPSQIPSPSNLPEKLKTSLDVKNKSNLSVISHHDSSIVPSISESSQNQSHSGSSGIPASSTDVKSEVSQKIPSIGDVSSPISSINSPQVSSTNSPAAKTSINTKPKSFLSILPTSNSLSTWKTSSSQVPSTNNPPQNATSFVDMKPLPVLSLLSAIDPLIIPSASDFPAIPSTNSKDTSSINTKPESMMSPPLPDDSLPLSASQNLKVPFLSKLPGKLFSADVKPKLLLSTSLINSPLPVSSVDIPPAIPLMDDSIPTSSTKVSTSILPNSQPIGVETMSSPSIPPTIDSTESSSSSLLDDPTSLFPTLNPLAEKQKASILTDIEPSIPSELGSSISTKPKLGFHTSEIHAFNTVPEDCNHDFQTPVSSDNVAALDSFEKDSSKALYATISSDKLFSQPANHQIDALSSYDNCSNGFLPNATRQLHKDDANVIDESLYQDFSAIAPSNQDVNYQQSRDDISETPFQQINLPSLDHNFSAFSTIPVPSQDITDLDSKDDISRASYQQTNLLSLDHDFSRIPLSKLDVNNKKPTDNIFGTSYQPGLTSLDHERMQNPYILHDSFTHDSSNTQSTKYEIYNQQTSHDSVDDTTSDYLPHSMIKFVSGVTPHSTNSQDDSTTTLPPRYVDHDVDLGPSDKDEQEKSLNDVEVKIADNDQTAGKTFSAILSPPLKKKLSIFFGATPQLPSFLSNNEESSYDSNSAEEMDNDAVPKTASYHMKKVKKKMSMFLAATLPSLVPSNNTAESHFPDHEKDPNNFDEQDMPSFYHQGASSHSRSHLTSKAMAQGKYQKRVPKAKKLRGAIHSQHQVHMLTNLQLIAITFFAVSGGPYGFEPTVGAGGPGLMLVGLLFFPALWAAPLAYMTAELSCMIPESGGHVLWVYRAFGPFWSFVNSCFAFACSVLDNAMYPVLFVEYLSALFYEGKNSIAYGWSVFLKVFIISIVTIINILGVDIVGFASVFLGLMMLAPLATMCLVGLLHLNFEWMDSTSSGSSGGPAIVDWQKFVTLLLWNTSGFDAAGTCAAEVRNPSQSYPHALKISVALIVAVYALPTIIGVSVIPNYADWTEGTYIIVAKVIGGNFLKNWMGLSAASSALGLLLTRLCFNSRIVYGMAQVEQVPPVFAKLHPMYATPWVAILATSLCTLLLTGFNFYSLAEADMLFYAFSTILKFAALVQLRFTEPDAFRPYRIPIENIPLAVCAIVPIGLCVSIIWLSSEHAHGLLLAGASVAILLFLVKEVCTQYGSEAEEAMNHRMSRMQQNLNKMQQRIDKVIAEEFSAPLSNLGDALRSSNRQLRYGLQRHTVSRQPAENADVENDTGSRGRFP